MPRLPDRIPVPASDAGIFDVPSGYVEGDLESYLPAIAKAIVKLSNKNHGEPVFSKHATLAALPDGYHLFSQVRQKGNHVDRYIMGHPSGRKMRSANEFAPHFVYLANARSQPCECILCPKSVDSEIDSEPSHRKRKRGTLSAPDSDTDDESILMNVPATKASRRLHVHDSEDDSEEVEEEESGSAANDDDGDKSTSSDESGFSIVLLESGVMRGAEIVNVDRDTPSSELESESADFVIQLSDEDEGEGQVEHEEGLAIVISDHESSAIKSSPSPSPPPQPKRVARTRTPLSKQQNGNASRPSTGRKEPKARSPSPPPLPSRGRGRPPRIPFPSQFNSSPQQRIPSSPPIPPPRHIPAAPIHHPASSPPEPSHPPTPIPSPYKHKYHVHELVWLPITVTSDQPLTIEFKDLAASTSTQSTLRLDLSPQLNTWDELFWPCIVTDRLESHVAVGAPNLDDEEDETPVRTVYAAHQTSIMLSETRSDDAGGCHVRMTSARSHFVPRGTEGVHLLDDEDDTFTVNLHCVEMLGLSNPIRESFYIDGDALRPFESVSVSEGITAAMSRVRGLGGQAIAENNASHESKPFAVADDQESLAVLYARGMYIAMEYATDKNVCRVYPRQEYSLVSVTIPKDPYSHPSSAPQRSIVKDKSWTYLRIGPTIIGLGDVVVVPKLACWSSGAVVDFDKVKPERNVSGRGVVSQLVSPLDPRDTVVEVMRIQYREEGEEGVQIFGYLCHLEKGREGDEDVAGFCVRRTWAEGSSGSGGLEVRPVLVRCANQRITKFHPRFMGRWNGRVCSDRVVTGEWE
ncbi:hypothetical protein HDU98_002323 [Podochytrium sp. JEL0797]|nr:hypothetical protein HDU98_002323 [Podochytrium sp. JEL0797]